MGWGLRCVPGGQVLYAPGSVVGERCCRSNRPHLKPLPAAHRTWLMPHATTTLQALHRTVNQKIAEFQEGVARRAAAHAADPSWAYQRLWRTLSSWEGLTAAARGAVPSPWGAVVLLMIGSFVKSIVEQFAQVCPKGWGGGGLFLGGRRGAAGSRFRPIAACAATGKAALHACMSHGARRRSVCV